MPCECSVQYKPLSPFNIDRHVLQLNCIEHRHRSFNATHIFHRLSQLKSHIRQWRRHESAWQPRQVEPKWYFDKVVLHNITHLQVNTFANVDFGELHIEMSDYLGHIPPGAISPHSSIQKLRISEVNFTSDKLPQTFRAINELTNLRSLYIWSANIEFVPEFAFSQRQSHLTEILLYSSNIRGIGSHAFSNLPSLGTLSIDGNDLVLIDKYAFATSYSTNEPLQVSLASNNLRESSFTFMSLNGAQRPLHITFSEPGGCYWNMQYLDEQIFAPFLDVANNRIHLERECQLNCHDCRMRWLVEAPKHVQRRIRLANDDEWAPSTATKSFVPCAGGEGENLFDIYEYLDWDKCTD